MKAMIGILMLAGILTSASVVYLTHKMEVCVRLYTSIPNKHYASWEAALLCEKRLR